MYLINLFIDNAMRYTELGKTGLKLSNLSFGASSLGSVFHETKKQRVLKRLRQLSKVVLTSSMLVLIMAIIKLRLYWEKL